MKTELETGLLNKYTVYRNDGRDCPGRMHHGCHYFVLDLDHDAIAVEALKFYAENFRETHPEIFADLQALIEEHE